MPLEQSLQLYAIVVKCYWHILYSYMSLALSLQLHAITVYSCMPLTVSSYMPLAVFTVTCYWHSLYSYMSLAPSLVLHTSGSLYSYMSLVQSLQLHVIGTVFTVTYHWHSLNSYVICTVSTVTCHYSLYSLMPLAQSLHAYDPRGGEQDGNWSGNIPCDFYVCMLNHKVHFLKAWVYDLFW